MRQACVSTCHSTTKYILKRLCDFVTIRFWKQKFCFFFLPTNDELAHYHVISANLSSLCSFNRISYLCICLSERTTCRDVKHLRRHSNKCGTERFMRQACVPTSDFSTANCILKRRHVWSNFVITMCDKYYCSYVRSDFVSLYSLLEKIHLSRRKTFTRTFK